MSRLISFNSMAAFRKWLRDHPDMEKATVAEVIRKYGKTPRESKPAPPT